MTRSQRRRENRTPGVLVAYCHRDEGPRAFDGALQALLMHDGQGPGHIMRHGDILAYGSGTRLANSRNEIIEGFLEHSKQPDWLFMTDDDMIFAPTVVETFLRVVDKDERPLVGGLAFTGGRTGKIRPTIQRLVADAEGGRPTLETVFKYPPNTLFLCDATGAAALFMHRSIFEPMRERYAETGYPWFAEAQMSDGSGDVGEDITFCLRARSMDIPLYVHTGIRFGHMKTMVIDETSYVEYLQKLTALGSEEAFTLEYQKRMFYVPEEMELAPEPRLKVVGDGQRP